jgi:hypothetical protein
VRRWPETQYGLCAADPKETDEGLLEGALLYLDGWLHEGHHAGMKARGF